MLLHLMCHFLAKRDSGNRALAAVQAELLEVFIESGHPGSFVSAPIRAPADASARQDLQGLSIAIIRVNLVVVK